ncbi:MAG: endonuclease/exonuclease/phosphatase family protein [Kofleriaceae bacterium]|nr:endonuclease/exonuclease/phosphatase family protein [Kofleriaceae bacterium]
MAPGGNTDKGKRTAAQAAEVIKELLDKGIELVALCEVNEETATAIADMCNSKVVTMCLKEKRGKWDLAIVFKKGIRCEDPTRVLANNTIRAAFSWNIVSDTGPSFHLYLLHWKSRLMDGGNDERECAAQALWANVSRRLSDAEPVVIMGDFNDEPFDRSVTKKLYAVRDPDFVRRNRMTSLYNPMWPLSCPPTEDPWGAFGSYAYKGRRFLLDQAITSAYFLDHKSGRIPSVRMHRSILTTNDHTPLELCLGTKATL